MPKLTECMYLLFGSLKWLIEFDEFNYLANFVCEIVCLVAVFHKHLILRLCFVLIVQLDNIAVVHLFMNATLALGIHPVVISHQFVFANYFSHHVLYSDNTNINSINNIDRYKKCKMKSKFNAEWHCEQNTKLTRSVSSSLTSVTWVALSASS